MISSRPSSPTFSVKSTDSMDDVASTSSSSTSFKSRTVRVVETSSAIDLCKGLACNLSLATRSLSSSTLLHNVNAPASAQTHSRVSLLMKELVALVQSSLSQIALAKEDMTLLRNIDQNAIQNATTKYINSRATAGYTESLIIQSIESHVAGLKEDILEKQSSVSSRIELALKLLNGDIVGEIVTKQESPPSPIPITERKVAEKQTITESKETSPGRKKSRKVHYIVTQNNGAPNQGSHPSTSGATASQSTAQQTSPTSTHTAQGNTSSSQMEKEMEASPITKTKRQVFSFLDRNTTPAAGVIRTSVITSMKRVALESLASSIPIMATQQSRAQTQSASEIHEHGTQTNPLPLEGRDIQSTAQQPSPTSTHTAQGNNTTSTASQSTAQQTSPTTTFLEKAIQIKVEKYPLKEIQTSIVEERALTPQQAIIIPQQSIAENLNNQATPLTESAPVYYERRMEPQTSQTQKLPLPKNSTFYFQNYRTNEYFGGTVRTRLSKKLSPNPHFTKPIMHYREGTKANGIVRSAYVKPTIRPQQHYNSPATQNEEDSKKSS
ncbi:MAG: hypothetical protein ACRCV3_02435 [Desulfovibrionaceae bacterium]